MRPITANQVTAKLKKIKPFSASLVGAPIDKNSLVALVTKIAREFKSTGELDLNEVNYAYDELEHLLGRTVTQQMLTANITRVIANWHFIREHMHIPEWDGSKTDSDLIVIGVTRAKTDAYGKPRYMALIKLKTGLCAGIIQCALLNSSAVYGFLQRESGTSKMDCAAEEIAGMQARACVSAEPNGTIKIHHWTATEQMKKHNRDLAERRIDVLKCASPVPCNVCSHTVKECPLAVWLPSLLQNNNQGGQNG